LSPKKSLALPTVVKGRQKKHRLQQKWFRPRKQSVIRRLHRLLFGPFRLASVASTDASEQRKNRLTNSLRLSTPTQYEPRCGCPLRTNRPESSRFPLALMSDFSTSSLHGLIRLVNLIRLGRDYRCEIGKMLSRADSSDCGQFRVFRMW